MSLATTALTKACGTSYIPGNADRFYVIQKGDITTFASASSPVAYGEDKVFDTAFTLGASAQWTEVDSLVNTSEVIDAVQGEVGGQFIRNSFVFFVPGNAKEQKKWADDMVANSGCLVCLVKSKDGAVHIVGNLDNPCYLESLQGGTGGPENARVGFAYRVYADTGYSSPLYTGAIDLTT